MPPGRNVATPEQYEHVKAHVDMINNAPDLRKLMKQTIRRRRRMARRGGLGLIRLVAENKFKIAAFYEDGCLVVDSTLSVGELL